jgi:hypothetical protein
MKVTIIQHAPKENAIAVRVWQGDDYHDSDVKLSEGETINDIHKDVVKKFPDWTAYELSVIVMR